ncbi:MAG: DUF3095 domain-containing protein [Chitinophagaceae bacterium]|nr:MAG: DUF3095 domain-containing protein [Chitinophagaceae bacterium]
MAVYTDQFYSELPVNHLPVAGLLLSQDLFFDVPADWSVIITDIKSSTIAVQKGLHENVNLVATGSIVSLLNLAFKNNITVPFFFGGDGATLIVPPGLVNKVIPALVLHKENTLKIFDLELRIGVLPVQTIYGMGHTLKICKVSMSRILPIPVLLGNGLNYAEKIIKGKDYLLAQKAGENDELDLSGMQCRWERIPPPENKDEVVTLLVISSDASIQHEVFSEVISTIDEIYGTPMIRQPISVSRLKLNTTMKGLETEMRVGLGKIRHLKLLQTWLIALIGPLYFRTRVGKRYLTRLVEMSDTLVIDGKINTVISGTLKQRDALQAELDRMESSGKIIYGLHVSNSSIMSCYVRDMEDGHIHFVDGSEGGYTHAAKELKRKITIVGESR